MKILFFFLMVLCSIQTFGSSCYSSVLKIDSPNPKTVNLLLIDTTTPLTDSAMKSYENIIDIIARSFGQRTIVVPFSALTMKSPPIALLDVTNEQPLNEKELDDIPIKTGKVFVACVQGSTKKNAIEIKKLVHETLKAEGSMSEYSEIPYAIKSTLDAYQSSLGSSRVRVIIYSDGYINSLRGFTMYANGKPKIPNPEKDFKLYTKLEAPYVAKRPFEVIWIGLGAIPDSVNNKGGYVAPKDLENLNSFWSQILKQFGASNIQAGFILNNPILE